MDEKVFFVTIILNKCSIPFLPFKSPPSQDILDSFIVWFSSHTFKEANFVVPMLSLVIE
jgi:hypothetical protein